jgi:hypothetical protein
MIKINENHRIFIRSAILVTAIYVLYQTAEFALTATKGHASVYRWISCELIVICMIWVLRIKWFQATDGMMRGVSNLVQVLYVLVGVIACLHLAKAI